jgi:RIO-like serine/threonine protein kinase
MKLKQQIIDNKYQDLLDNITTYFANGKVIYHDRNIVKEVSYLGQTYVIKRFKVPNKIHRYTYTYFRKSKAKRSYLHSLQLGSFSPRPIAYLEYYNNGLLDQSYFISEKFDFDFDMTIALAGRQYDDRVNLLKQFTQFIYSLHENRIMHLDLWNGNVLVKQDNDKYEFRVVDNNRMKFIDPSISLRAKNFQRLGFSESDFNLVFSEYARLIDTDVDEFVKYYLAHNKKHEFKNHTKKKLKKLKKLFK